MLLDKEIAAYKREKHSENRLPAESRISPTFCLMLGGRSCGFGMGGFILLPTSRAKHSLVCTTTPRTEIFEGR